MTSSAPFVFSVPSSVPSAPSVEEMDLMDRSESYPMDSDCAANHGLHGLPRDQCLQRLNEFAPHPPFSSNSPLLLAAWLLHLFSVHDVLLHRISEPSCRRAESNKRTAEGNNQGAWENSRAVSHRPRATSILRKELVTGSKIYIEREKMRRRRAWTCCSNELGPKAPLTLLE
ncbi:hypothetical protein BC936DRAFT_147413 [Jimgerdemannia flammicorona]|uniref:Uncharacterized protein n=1 Tax=Jimgerdemannia flammicorona TaxID=994334 RepID=A0A433D5E2_9FUNG|nr:hypothetical protein BC936DRAFT_147413 [Jimgerdemannia flammicorona]